MTASNAARQGYSASAAPIRTNRSTEYRIFAIVTHRLTVAAAKGRTAFGQLAEALHENRRLWTLLAADVAEDTNELPDTLRARIFYLAEFTSRHTSEVLLGKADPAALIDINTAVMRGLRSEGGST